MKVRAGKNGLYCSSEDSLEHEVLRQFESHNLVFYHEKWKTKTTIVPFSDSYDDYHIIIFAGGESIVCQQNEKKKRLVNDYLMEKCNINDAKERIKWDEQITSQKKQELLQEELDKIINFFTFIDEESKFKALCNDKKKNRLNECYKRPISKKELEKQIAKRNICAMIMTQNYDEYFNVMHSLSNFEREKYFRISLQTLCLEYWDELYGFPLICKLIFNASRCSTDITINTKEFSETGKVVLLPRNKITKQRLGIYDAFDKQLFFFCLEKEMKKKLDYKLINQDQQYHLGANAIFQGLKENFEKEFLEWKNFMTKRDLSEPISIIETKIYKDILSAYKNFKELILK
ncbi:MAG: hypothetical protein ABIC91_00320 [Nanoarchaeota archaeon]